MIRPLLILGALGMASSLYAQKPTVKLPPNLPPILLKAMAASGKLRYTGTRVVEFRKGPDTVRHEEYLIRDGAKLRIEFPDTSPFAGQVIVEDGVVRRHFFPDKNEIHVLPPRRDEATMRLRRLTRPGSKMTFATESGDRVAGYGTREVVVKDQAGNVVQRMFIEPKSGLVLKRLLFDPVGAPVGSFTFTKIDLHPTINPAVFRFSRQGATLVTPLDLLRRNLDDGPFVLRTLPPDSGYRLEFSRVMKPEGRPILMQIYTGNGRRLSLFQLEGDIDSDRLKRFARDRDSAYSWQSDGRTFVLVGNMRQEELRALAGRLTERD